MFILIPVKIVGITLNGAGFALVLYFSKEEKNRLKAYNDVKQ